MQLLEALTKVPDLLAKRLEQLFELGTTGGGETLLALLEHLACQLLEFLTQAFAGVVEQCQLLGVMSGFLTLTRDQRGMGLAQLGVALGQCLETLLTLQQLGLQHFLLTGQAACQRLLFTQRTRLFIKPPLQRFAQRGELFRQRIARLPRLLQRLAQIALLLLRLLPIQCGTLLDQGRPLLGLLL